MRCISALSFYLGSAAVTAQTKIFNAEAEDGLLQMLHQEKATLLRNQDAEEKQVSFDHLGEGYPRQSVNDDWHCWWKTKSSQLSGACNALCERMTDVDCLGYSSSTDGSCLLYTSSCWVPEGEGCCDASIPSKHEKGPWEWTARPTNLVAKTGVQTYWRHKKCTCRSGTAAPSSECPQDGAEKCTGCNIGYTLTCNDVCQRDNTCTCAHGEAAQNSECTEDGAEICTRCDDVGYALNSNKVCQKRCGCRHGRAAQSDACTQDGAEICTECNDGYELDSNNVCQVKFVFVGIGYPRDGNGGQEDWHCWSNTKSEVDDAVCESLCARQTDVDCLGYQVNGVKCLTQKGEDCEDWTWANTCALFTSPCSPTDTELESPAHPERGGWHSAALDMTVQNDDRTRDDAWVAAGYGSESELTKTYWRQEI